jgi:hypothetical protein
MGQDIERCMGKRAADREAAKEPAELVTGGVPYQFKPQPQQIYSGKPTPGTKGSEGHG